MIFAGAPFPMTLSILPHRVEISAACSSASQHAFYRRARLALPRYIKSRRSATADRALLVTSSLIRYLRCCRASRLMISQ